MRSPALISICVMYSPSGTLNSRFSPELPPYTWVHVAAPVESINWNCKLTIIASAKPGGVFAWTQTLAILVLFRQAATRLQTTHHFRFQTVSSNERRNFSRWRHSRFRLTKKRQQVELEIRMSNTFSLFYFIFKWFKNCGGFDLNLYRVEENHPS
jgi:hypothetical protein